jgi:hypothetical protein
MSNEVCVWGNELKNVVTYQCKINILCGHTPMGGISQPLQWLLHTASPLSERRVVFSSLTRNRHWVGLEALL